MSQARASGLLILFTQSRMQQSPGSGRRGATYAQEMSASAAARVHCAPRQPLRLNRPMILTGAPQPNVHCERDDALVITF